MGSNRFDLSDLLYNPAFAGTIEIGSLEKPDN